MDGVLEPDCIFCRIGAGLVPTAIVYENTRLMAFLDMGPIREGHTQIIPKAHYPTFDDLPPELAAEILHLGQRLARAMKRLYRVDRVAFLFSGGDIPHAHAHLVPMVETTDITSARYIASEPVTFRPLPTVPLEDRERTAALLREALAAQS